MQHDFILLDRSGSMREGGRWTETLGAVNGYVKKLADDKVDTGVTVMTFDKPDNAGVFDIIRDRIVPSTWHEITDRDASPRGYTPLNDAIGRIVTLAKAGINGQQYDKVAIIIVTDGLENASIETKHHVAKAMLDECRAKNWQVIFIGCDFDNAVQAAQYGNAAMATAAVRPEKMRFASASLGATRNAYGKTGAAMEFTEEEKASFSKS